MDNTTGQHDDLGIEDVGKRTQARTEREARLVNHGDRALITLAAKVVHIATDRWTGLINASVALLEHAADGRTGGHGFKMPGATAGARDPLCTRRLDVTHVAGSAMEAAHHTAVLDVGTADTGADTQAEHGIAVTADAPMGLAQAMGLNVADNGDRHPKSLA